MFVFNDCRNDARVLREAGSLAAAGHEVTVVARVADPSSADAETENRDGFRIIRVPIPQGRRALWRWFSAPWSLRPAWTASTKSAARRLPSSLPELLRQLGIGLVSLPWFTIRLSVRVASRGREARSGRSSLDWYAWWRLVLLGWAAAAAEAAPPGDFWHGHDATGLEAAGRAFRRRGGAIVYDSHEIFLESGSNAARPRVLKALIARSERGWTHRAMALVTVNDSLAAELGRRLRPRRTVVVHNAPDRWDPPPERAELIRAAAGIAADAAIALYHGGFSAHRGLEELAAAILEPGLECVHAVYLGYGSMRAGLDAMARDPRYGGRIHVLNAVPPSELIPWVASADVGVMPIQASTLNHRLSTPNKLFESLAGGLPVVVSDFPEMRSIVLDNPGGPLGEVCDPSDPASIAAAIRRVLDPTEGERRALRARCLAAAHERWNWEHESAALVALYAALAGEGGR